MNLSASLAQVVQRSSDYDIKKVYISSNIFINKNTFKQRFQNMINVNAITEYNNETLN